jgi:hypothetical protein
MQAERQVARARDHARENHRCCWFQADALKQPFDSVFRDTLKKITNVCSQDGSRTKVSHSVRPGGAATNIAVRGGMRKAGKDIFEEPAQSATGSLEDIR